MLLIQSTMSTILMLQLDMQFYEDAIFGLPEDLLKPLKKENMEKF
jgi:hypothetical protein